MPKGASIHWPRLGERRHRLSPVVAARVRRDALAFRRISLKCTAAEHFPRNHFVGFAGSPTTMKGAQYLGSARSLNIGRLALSIMARMDLRSASACDSVGSAVRAAKVPVISATVALLSTSQFDTIRERAPA